MIIVAISFCLPLWAEEEEVVWPLLPINIGTEISMKTVDTTLDLTIANLRHHRDIPSGLDRIDMTYRVIGNGMSCLKVPILLGIMVKQRMAATVHLPPEQEIYFEIHYSAGKNSIRGYIPLMANNGQEYIVEAERIELLTAGSTTVLLRGQWSPSQHSVGIGVSRKIGKHIEVRLFTNDPIASVVLKYELRGFSEQ